MNIIAIMEIVPQGKPDNSKDKCQSRLPSQV